MKRIYKYILIVVITGLVAFFIRYLNSTQQEKQLTTAGPPHDGRSFHSLSLHPNEQEIIFVECHETLATHCGVLRYHLGTQDLQYYDLPRGYVYQEANFSPQGNYIVMKRIPFWEGNDKQIREAYEHAEIAMMKLDGSDFYVFPLAVGPKTDPVMSNCEDKIAYWRNQLRKPGSKSFFADFDIWEIDIKTEEEQPFGGLFQFFEVSQMQYMPTDDEILLGAYGPMTDGHNRLSISTYKKEYARSAIYQLKRGQATLPTPLFFQGLIDARMPTMDYLGNIYYEGVLPEIYLFKNKGLVSVQKWAQKVEFTYIRNLVASPHGDFLIFTYNAPGSDYRAPDSRAIGKLDTKKGEWQRITIPKLDTAKAIAVRMRK